MGRRRLEKECEHTHSKIIDWEIVGKSGVKYTNQCLDCGKIYEGLPSEEERKKVQKIIKKSMRYVDHVL